MIYEAISTRIWVEEERIDYTIFMESPFYDSKMDFILCGAVSTSVSLLMFSSVPFTKASFSIQIPGCWYENQSYYSCVLQYPRHWNIIMFP